MGILLRVKLYLQRHWIKTIIISLVFFITSLFLYCGLAVNHAVENAQISVRSKMKPVVKVKAKDDFKIDSNVINNLMDNQYVLAINAISLAKCYSSFESYHLNNKVDNSFLPSYCVYGNASEKLIELKNGTVEIIDGRFFSNAELQNAERVIVISEEIAKMNDLEINDYIDLSYHELKEYYYQIVGIYRTTLTDDTTDVQYLGMPDYSSVYNLIYMPSTTLYNDCMAEKENNNLKSNYREVMLLLSDSLKINEAIEAYRQVEWFNSVDFISEDDSFAKIEKPFVSLGFFARLISIIVLVNAIIIVSLISIINIETRRDEIGLNMSLGVKNRTLFYQFSLEMFCCAVIGFAPALIAGAYISNTIADNMLNRQIKIEEKYTETDSTSMDLDYFTAVEQSDFIEGYKVNNDINEMMEIGAFIILIVFLASGVTVILITLQKPKEILQKEE